MYEETNKKKKKIEINLGFEKKKSEDDFFLFLKVTFITLSHLSSKRKSKQTVLKSLTVVQGTLPNKHD